MQWQDYTVNNPSICLRLNRSVVALVLFSEINVSRV